MRATEFFAEVSQRRQAQPRRRAAMVRLLSGSVMARQPKMAYPRTMPSYSFCGTLQAFFGFSARPAAPEPPATAPPVRHPSESSSVQVMSSGLARFVPRNGVGSDAEIFNNSYLKI